MYGWGWCIVSWDPETLLLLRCRLVILTDDHVQRAEDELGGLMRVCSTGTACAVDDGCGVVWEGRAYPAHLSPLHASLSTICQHRQLCLQSVGRIVAILVKMSWSWSWKELGLICRYPFCDVWKKFLVEMTVLVRDQCWCFLQGKGCLIGLADLLMLWISPGSCCAV